ncbi:hypothetical protein OIU76_005852 [Salix suchowensis]|nr:hypothetical protein OIU76_005852 [Salix suchowensis]
MTETSSSSSSSATTIISKDLPSENVLAVERFFEGVGIHASPLRTPLLKTFIPISFATSSKLTMSNVAVSPVSSLSCLLLVITIMGYMEALLQR